jgi:L-lactate dehydrogenase complex protein LldF
MITPAIHKTLPQIRDVLAREANRELPVDREALTEWARERLRGEFLRGDIGITGVNFAAADTGTLVLVTNEGNGRFCTTWPRTHIALMPVEKVIPRLADTGVLLPLLTSHATGQPLSNYVTMLSGPRRDGEADGPDELHVVFLDNRRRTLLGTKYEEMLACIRCGACLNVCPVYRNVSGHAYDSVYSGPMGKVLTPLLSGGAEGTDLPYGSSLCHACSDACPVQIPLGDMIVALRSDVPAPETGERRRRRLFWATWARAWSTPRGYRVTSALGRMSRGRVPGLRAWTATRDLPTPARRSFRERWAEEHP